MATVKNDGQINVRLPEEVLASLLEIEKRHKITPNEMLRSLAAAAADFYKSNRWFSFPVTITPEKFQNTEVAPAEKTPRPEVKPQPIPQAERIKKYIPADPGDEQFAQHLIALVPRTGARYRKKAKK